MKRLFALILCLLTVASLAACGGAESTPAETTAPSSPATEPAAEFSVGYGRVDITPSLGVALQGFANPADRLATNVLDPLYVTCTALRDPNGNTALLIGIDSIRTERKVFLSVSRKIEKELGVPQDQIFYSSTHSHSTPDSGTYDNVGTALEAARMAIEDLKPAKMYITKTNTEGINFVRHYYMDDGSVVGDNYGIATGKKYAGHVSDADTEMRLIKFVREGGKDVVLMNWQCHATWTCTKDSGALATDISADYIANCRTTIEKKADCHFAYFNGAGGNLSPKSRIASENKAKTYNEHGKIMADTALSALNNMQEVQTGEIKVINKTIEGKIRKTTAEFAAAAAAFQEVYNNGGTTEEAIIASGGIVNSIYAVNAMGTRAGMGDTEDIHLIAMSIGDVAFCGVEPEMFDSNGVDIRNGSPYEMTFILGYCNGKNGYIPNAKGYETGCYEMDNGYYEAGTGELLASEYVSMLKELNG